MTTRAVASVPKEQVLQHAAPAAQDASNDFLQFLSTNGLMSFGPNLPVAGDTSENPIANDRGSAKSKKADAEAAATTEAAQGQAAIIVPPGAVTPTPVAKSGAQSQPTATAVTAPQASAAALPATAAGATPQPATNLANRQSSSPQSGAPTSQPPSTGGTNTAPPATQPFGAAELNARIAAGAPTYLSQPNSVLAGLWHHAGDAANEGAAAATGDAADASGADAATTDASTATTPAATAAKTLTSAAAQTATSAHTVPGVVGALASDSAMAALSAPSADAAAGAAALPPTTASGTAPSASAASATPTPAALPFGSPAEQVALNLKQAAQSGNDQIQIQLKPPSLGTIAVKLDLSHDGHVSAVISADRSDTLNLLQQDSSGLEQALRDAGLNADSGSLSFNLRGDPQSFAQNSAPSPTPATTAAAGTATAAAGDPSRYRRHDGALDIQV